jgi:hypothetical protein
MAKHKDPRRPASLEAVLQELESTLAQHKASHDREAEKNTFMRGVYFGYEDGMRRAIEIVNGEIGIRQNPPNINYPGEL